MKKIVLSLLASLALVFAFSGGAFAWPYDNVVPIMKPIPNVANRFVKVENNTTNASIVRIMAFNDLHIESPNFYLTERQTPIQPGWSSTINFYDGTPQCYFSYVEAQLNNGRKVQTSINACREHLLRINEIGSATGGDGNSTLTYKYDNGTIMGTSTPVSPPSTNHLVKIVNDAPGIIIKVSSRAPNWVPDDRYITISPHTSMDLNYNYGDRCLIDLFVTYANGAVFSYNNFNLCVPYPWWKIHSDN